LKNNYNLIFKIEWLQIHTFVPLVINFLILKNNGKLTRGVGKHFKIEVALKEKNS